MSDLGLMYCPAADPDLDTRVKTTTYYITQKTHEQIKAGFEANGFNCTMSEVRLIKRWMNTDPYETTDGQYGEYVNHNLQMGKKEIAIGFRCLRAYRKDIVNIDESDPLETKFSFTDNDGEYSFKMPTMLGKYFLDNKIQWG